MKYDIQFTNQFKKDLKLAKKQNKNLDKLFEVIDSKNDLQIIPNLGTICIYNQFVLNLRTNRCVRIHLIKVSHIFQFRRCVLGLFS